MDWTSAPILCLPIDTKRQKKRKKWIGQIRSSTIQADSYRARLHSWWGVERVSKREICKRSVERWLRNYQRRKCQRNITGKKKYDKARGVTLILEKLSSAGEALDSGKSKTTPNLICFCSIRE